MPLSDHEQRMLEQMEQALAAEDPKFASQMQGSVFSGAGRRRWMVGALGVILGLGLVLVGITVNTWVGVGGFVIMLAAAIYAATPPRRPNLTSVDASGRPNARKDKKQRSFMDKLDERWERRENRW